MCFIYIVVVEYKCTKGWQGMAYIPLLIILLLLGLAMQVAKKPIIMMTFFLAFFLVLVYLGNIAKSFLNRFPINRPENPINRPDNLLS